MFSYIKAKIKYIIKKIEYIIEYFALEAEGETFKRIRTLLLTTTPLKWGILLIFLLLLGRYLCKVTSYPISTFYIVFIGLNSISTVSLFSEQKFVKNIRQFESEILGHSESYDNNMNVASLLAKYNKTWNISGDVLLKAMFTIIFFSIIGIGLMGKNPPNLLLAFFLLIFIFAVGISMIGYFQYEALYKFILEFPDIYKPSRGKFFWVTQKRYAWVAQLAKLYDFYSTIFFCLALLYALACCTFCFHKDFGVLTGQKSIVKIILLIIFWSKVILELVFKFLYKLYLGKKKITLLGNIIKENCINIIQHNFVDPVASEKDFEGFNLYLQLQQINIIPKTNLILSFIRALSYIANSIVTIASLYTLLVQAF